MTARYAAVGFLYHAESGTVLLHHRGGNTTFYPWTWAGFGGSNEPEDGGNRVAGPDAIRP